MESLRDVTIPPAHLPATVVSFKLAMPQANGPDIHVDRGTPICIYEHTVMEPPTDEEEEDEEPEEYPPASHTILATRKKPRGPPVAKRRRTFLNSPCEGTLERLAVAPGDCLTRPDAAVVVIKEPCSHAVQYFGQCAICGKDLTYLDASAASGSPDTARATISMAHDATGLTVSRGEAERLEHQNAERLRTEGRLSLIVDLDQTIVHANATRESLDAWLAQCPPEIRDHVGVFQLPDSPLLYYLKLRPGLRDFLRRVTAKYELHIYTMGTRAYAAKVAELIDPDGRYFKERILSRDESGSLTHKNIQRLFPCDASMVVAIDDRADVWQNSPNLIKVKPYSFFSGIGDINAGFLPKSTLPPASTVPSATTLPPPTVVDQPAAPVALAEPAPAPTEPTPALANELKATSPAGEPEAPKEGAKVTTAGATETAPPAGQSITPPSDLPVRFKHPFEDPDRELGRIADLLDKVHGLYYPKVNQAPPPDADVTRLLPRLKRQVLRGVHLVFSSVIPLQANPRTSDIWQWARSFGAECSEDLSPQVQRSRTHRVTHLVAGKPDTAKAKDARRLGGIEVVRFEWLVDSLHAWQHLDEAPYRWPKPIRSGGTVPKTTTATNGVEAEAEVPPAEVLHTTETWLTQSDREDASNESDAFSHVSDSPASSLEPTGLSAEDMSAKLATVDWEEADREMLEFMGSDSEDDDEDKSQEESGDGDEVDGAEPEGNELAEQVADDLRGDLAGDGNKVDRSAPIRGKRPSMHFEDDEDGTGPLIRGDNPEDSNDTDAKNERSGPAAKRRKLPDVERIMPPSNSYNAEEGESGPASSSDGSSTSSGSDASGSESSSDDEDGVDDFDDLLRDMEEELDHDE